MELGVFIPIGNNGWLISEAAPQYKPSFEHNREIVQAAEAYGFEFALSMIKLRGFGGKTEFWDHNLESFTLMSGLAAVTERIKLFASTPVLALPPAIVARMAITADSIAPGRFGVNIVTGWQGAEYSQMGIWPGEKHFTQRYDYATEYVRVMRDLWETGTCTLDGEHFTMDDCRLGPLPEHKIEIVTAGQSDRGMRFCAELCDYNFVLGSGVNTPTAHAATNDRLAAAAELTGRDVGTYVLFMVIADETDELARARWDAYGAGIDVDAIAWMQDQAGKDATPDAHVRHISLPEGAVNFNMGTLVGSYESVARMMDEAAALPGTKGIMLTFDDFVTGIHDFGTRIQPLMASRGHAVAA
jgi:pyrimidine oxygenase